MRHGRGNGRRISPRFKDLLWILAAGIAVLYFVVPAALLRWDIDRLVFSAQSNDRTHEDKRFDVAVSPEATVVVRRYGMAGQACAFFFPGQHGGIGTYERTLFPLIREGRADVYAISYPGQDGAKGHSYIALLPDQIALALAQVSKATRCGMSRSVFVGRSLGATMALVEATKFKPKGVLVDGLGADLSSVIRAWIRRHPALIGWQMLPVRGLLGRWDYSAASLLRQIPSVPVAIYQGTADVVTPYALARSAASGQPNVAFTTVDGGTHQDTYMLAGAAYARSLHQLLEADISRSR
ncbi:alpha/beta hydrolase [Rhodanobacter sp. DHG33]|uniref:alpha/beta fold hydrolase n=1 Tax=Rhodanobacter sp. DHG33 TaxID=2775921 RepID=UPI0017858A87|nr:alpha/beta hydrolase [Rhodanobacter sp. DHG33]MBD8899856.1 alpha/beta hydrolase [Rhodanobacter sp. DHG33]